METLDISSWIYLNAMLEVFDDVTIKINGSDINIENKNPEIAQNILLFHNNFIQMLNARGPYTLEVGDV